MSGCCNCSVDGDDAGRRGACRGASRSQVVLAAPVAGPGGVAGVVVGPGRGALAGQLPGEAKVCELDAGFS